MMGWGATSVATSMRYPSEAKIAVVIAGPTASGKSRFGVELAKRMGGEIVNADALQLYADLQLLSARPTLAEMEGVAHHLYGTWDGSEAASAAQWRDVAITTLNQIWKKQRVPIIIGGTGLYLRTLLDGIAYIPDIPPALREAVRAMEPAALAAALAQDDPAMAATLNPNDRQRLARALEVVRGTGRSLRSFHGPQTDGLAQTANVITTRLLPERSELYARCDARLDQMIADGALDEVRQLDARSLPADLPVMKAVGVPELLAHVRGEMDLAAAVAAAKRATRHYAKRQYTWFRNQCEGWDVNLEIEDLVILLRELALTLK
jgi:tRNA dimethylallyltransferase